MKKEMPHVDRHKSEITHILNRGTRSVACVFGLLSASLFLGNLATPAHADTTMYHPQRAYRFWQSIGINVHLGDYPYSDSTKWNNVIKPRLVELGLRSIRTSGIGLDTAQTGKMNELFGESIKTLLVHGKGDYLESKMNMDVDKAIADLTTAKIIGFEGPNEWSKFDPDYINIGAKKYSDNGTAHGDWNKEVVEYQILFQNYLATKGWTAAKPLVSPTIWGRRTAGYAKLANTDLNDDGNIEGISDFCNRAGLHYYTGNKPTLYSRSGNWIDLDYAISDLKSMVNAKVWATETGYATAVNDEPGAGQVSEQAQAKYVPRLVAEMFNRQVEQTFIFELIDTDNDNDGQPDMGYGLLRFNDTPKPAFHSLRNLITLLKDTRANAGGFSVEDIACEFIGANDDTHFIWLQKARWDESGEPGRHYLLIWQDVTTTDATRNVTLSFGGASKHVRKATPLNSASYTDMGTVSSITLQVPDHILVLEIY